MNSALVSIGSNENPEQNLLGCCRLLAQLFPDILFSKTSVTVPYGNNYKNDFFNCLAVINTDIERQDCVNKLKQLERDMGRTPNDKFKGCVKIDIDLVIWNREVLKPKDLERSYVKDLLLDLNIEF